MTVETITDQAEGLLNSRALPYVLAALLAALWWAAHGLRRLLGRSQPQDEPRPRRRLPLD